METTKICLTCGRKIEPRKKWKRVWDEIKFCGEKCRRMKNTVSYEEEIISLLKKRGRGKTICPSEVLSAELRTDKAVMEKVRQSARRLVAQGQIIITQNGHEVDPSSAKGPIRLKLLEKGR